MVTEKFLYEELDSASKWGFLIKEIPDFVSDNLNEKFELRPYQIEAFTRFFHCMKNEYPGKEWPLHFAINMATGSGKTLIMAGLILYLFEKGYRNFLFFVNSTNIIEKTKDNFLNPNSMKFLLNENLIFGKKRVHIISVENFEGANPNNINVCFTTIQKLHFDLTTEKENNITYEDFKDKKIALIADEAHHIQTKTKRNSPELIDIPSWENTVERIFRQREDNILLEFTATLDYTHKSIVDKYRNKVLYRYDLREFRNDRYSKDIYIVQADFDERERIIQALILSQYKQEVAAKHRMNLKPVILLKAQKTIAQSKENKAKFHDLINNIAAENIERIRRKSDIPIVQRAFRFFDENGIGSEQLVHRLKVEFDETRCISVNEEKEKENYQLLVNSLEDKDNRIRAIFAVHKLNEGWDVLNLFDIVRCYIGRDSRYGRPGRTTISEAQLIGRGARYFPFVIENHEDRYRRKFDDDLENELRVLEELHYHSLNDSRYISELRVALIEEGMLDEREIECKLVLKKAFKKSEFYKKGLIYTNDQLINNYNHIKSFSDLGVKRRNYTYNIATGRGAVSELLSEDMKIDEIKEAGRRDILVKNIERHIVQNAIGQNIFYSFKNLKVFFPHLESIQEVIKSEEYLGSLELTFQGDEKDLYNLSNRVKLEALNGLLEQIEFEIRQNIKEYIGAKDFKPNNVCRVFTDKVLKLNKESERAKGDEQFVSDKDWYVYNANYGTSEEKAFVRMLERQLNKLQEKYTLIYLIRNEGHFKIYSFVDGKAFEPDFVLFLQETNGTFLTYQMFIEPKGRYLKEHDRWKEEFLKEITSHFGDKILRITQKHKYRLIGVPFYNNEDENIFKESLYAVLKK